MESLLSGRSMNTREIVLLRHGKSDWDSSAKSDHDRPLAKRGKRDAIRVGRFLSVVGAKPDYILCSTAARAVGTCKKARKAGKWKAPVELSDSLYVPTPEAVFEAIQNAPDTCERLLVVGHEPTWSQMVRLLSGATAAMPTAAAACIEVNVDNWSQVEPGGGLLLWLVTPKLLPEE